MKPREKTVTSRFSKKALCKRKSMLDLDLFMTTTIPNYQWSSQRMHPALVLAWSNTKRVLRNIICFEEIPSIYIWKALHPSKRPYTSTFHFHILITYRILFHLGLHNPTNLRYQGDRQELDINI